MNINHELSYKVLQKFIESKYKEYRVSCDKYDKDGEDMTSEEIFKRKFMRMTMPKFSKHKFYDDPKLKMD